VRDKSQKGYHRIVAWQRAHALALLVYDLTDRFPRHELFGLTRQLRDAALSVPANIVEGYSWGSSKHYLYHLNVARGSLAEVEYYLPSPPPLPPLAPLPPRSRLTPLSPLTHLAPLSPLTLLPHFDL
jgi:hypothetical protein